MTDLDLSSIALPAGAAPVACVDIGGTKVAVCVTDSNGMRGQVVEPTVREGNSGALADQLLRMLEHSAASAKIQLKTIAAVGISSCGPFVMNQGAVELAAPNICGGLAGPARGLPNDWISAPLEAPLREHFAHVRVENDGIASLEAERRWGALRKDGVALAHCAYVTWSTGIGVGLCVDGHVLRGKNGNAGHAGHIFVSSGIDTLCGCGNVGDVESLVAGNALPRRFAHLGYADANALMTAASQQDATAMEIVDGLCEVMGRMLFGLVATLDLQRISLGGSVYWHHRDLLLPKLQQCVQAKLPPLTQACDIVSAGLGQRVGDFAALALVSSKSVNFI